MLQFNLPRELEFLSEPLSNLGFQGAGYLKSTQPLSWEKYEAWLKKNTFGEMTYLNNHLSVKENLKKLRPEINSIFSLTHPYRTLTNEGDKVPFKALKIALYAQDSDYHLWLKEKLNQIILILRKTFPNDFFLATTDSFPILERDFSYQNGLGWIGKNSCLIHPQQGSLFLIGNILSSLQIESLKSSPIHDFCGKCNRCVEACPTQAIQNNKTLNADECISYWTIESKSSPPLALRNQLGDHFFGCDICQTVCPWNGKILSILTKNNNLTSEGRLSLSSDSDSDSGLGFSIEPESELQSELHFFLTASDQEIKLKLKMTALSRAKVFGLRRNAMIVIANKKMVELKNEIKTWLKDERLNELADWTLKILEE